MYQVNAISDNISAALALLAEKNLGSTVPTTDFINIKETQHESYMGVIIDNKLCFNQHIDDMSKTVTNLYNLYYCYLHTCPKEVKNSAYNMTVQPHLEYASTCWMITVQLTISVVKSRNIYNGIHCHPFELLQMCVCSTN